MVLGADGSAITNVDNIQIIIKGHYKVATAATFAILHLLCCLVLREHAINIVLIRHLRASINGCRHVRWKFWLQDNIIMQMLLKVLSTLITAMPVVHREYLYLRPHVVRELGSLGKGLDHVENNCNPVLVRFPDQTDMRIGGKRAHNTEFLV